MISKLVVPSGVVLIYMTCWYGVALWRGRNDLADIAWGPGFVIAMVASLREVKQVSWLSWLIFVMVTLWAFRLSIYIYLRNRGKGEDFRYRKWREDWGKHFYWRSYVQVFLVQGCFLVIIGLPAFMSVYSAPADAGLLTWLGVGLWALGFLFEAVSDFQMAQFRKHKTNSTSIMTSGLWKYSRHPNYFGESVLWWGIYLVSLSNSAPFWTGIGPILLTFLLIKVSGVPMLERKYAENKEYLEYQRSTSSFIPWIKKR